MGFTVHIVESPSGQNLLDRQLEGGALAESLRLMNVPSESYLVTSRELLEAALVRVAQSHLAGGRHEKSNPILHISCHGNDQGIALTSGETLEWRDLRPLLAPVQAALVGMSTCFGLHGMDMARSLDGTTPFLLLVGPCSKVLWPESLVGFITLYHRFTKEVPLTWPHAKSVIAAMNSAAGLPADTFQMVVAQHEQDEFRAAFVKALRERTKTTSPMVQAMRATKPDW